MLNPNEAPEGYIAVEGPYPVKNAYDEYCNKCAFEDSFCSGIPCTQRKREDRSNVYFVKKEPKMKHVHAELIKAWADGAKVEIYNRLDGDWRPICHPAWSEKSKYRIAPEPLVPDSIDWSQISTEYKYMARDQSNCAYLYTGMPTVIKKTWSIGVGYTAKANAFISYSKGTVDWKDSLVTRP